MSQFSTTRSNIGDMNIEAGAIIDITAGTTSVFSTALTSESEAIPENQGVSADRPAPRFVGGSSRNMVIESTINANIPSGWFKQIKKYEWAGEVGDFTATVAADGGIQWSNATDVIMTAPPGSLPLDDRISCSNLVASGSNGTYEYTVDLGTATGLVTLTFEAYSVPDIFIVFYNGTAVINTGYRGDSGTYDGVPVIVAGPGSGTASFTKSTASPSFCTVRIEAPFTGTAWEVNLSCPGGGAAPYTPSALGRKTFTASSTAYGQTLNGGSAFTLPVIYEGKQVSTQIQITCDFLFPEISSIFTLDQKSVTRWFDDTNGILRLEIDEYGTARIYDQANIIATRPDIAGFEQYLDPSGHYNSTAYGRNTYNNGVDFSASVSMINTPPLELYTYVKVAMHSGGGSSHVTGVTGPFSAPTLPANASHLKVIPISYSDGLGKITQYSEGAILWK